MKFYEPLEAVKLAQATARNRFEGKIEAHVNLKSRGKFGGYQTEKKAPLVHAVLGKQSAKSEKLAEELVKIIEVIGSHQIKKLVVCATMGPGIKVEVNKSA